jgi:hypothetical protein
MVLFVRMVFGGLDPVQKLTVYTVRYAKSLRLCKVQYSLITWSICNVITLL